MQLSITYLISTLLLAFSVSAYQPGEIPINVAVRSDGNGEIYHFDQRDAVAALLKAKRQNEAPESDTYPVSNKDGSGPKPFEGAVEAGEVEGMARPITK